jgi:hypothetical protein
MPFPSIDSRFQMGTWNEWYKRLSSYSHQRRDSSKDLGAKHRNPQRQDHAKAADVVKMESLIPIPKDLLELHKDVILA